MYSCRHFSKENGCRNKRTVVLESVWQIRDKEALCSASGDVTRLWLGGGCRRLDLCLRYTAAELKSQEHSGGIMRESIWTIPPFKKSIKIEGPVRRVTFKRCKCRQGIKLFRDFLEKWEMRVNRFVLLVYSMTMLGLLFFFFSQSELQYSTAKLVRIQSAVVTLPWKRSLTCQMWPGQMYWTICFIYQLGEKKSPQWWKLGIKYSQGLTTKYNNVQHEPRTSAHRPVHSNSLKVFESGALW